VDADMPGRKAALRHGAYNEPAAVLSASARAAISPGWIAAIVDRTGKFIARAPAGEARVGDLAAQPFRASMQRIPASVIDSVSLEGDR